VASRLQDFFGLTERPKVARGKAPLIVHLLVPNQRPVQTTTDLAGFGARLYPQLRREIGRRTQDTSGRTTRCDTYRRYRKPPRGAAQYPGRQTCPGPQKPATHVYP